MSVIKVAIADDHKIFRQGLVATVSNHVDVRLVFEASDGRELVESISDYHPDVVLMDIKMPNMDGLQATAAIHEKYRHVKVLALSMYDDEAYIIRMLQAGAKGYLLKNAEPDEIITAIRTVYSKNYYFNEQVSVAMLKELLTDEKIDFGYEGNKIDFSEREIHVLQLICDEFTNHEIGEKLYISARTVEGYRLRLMEKTQTKTTIGLVLYAIKNKLVEF